ncbi:MAG: hypothetical protein FLDDKLPJ_00368 [Phycisphaerae bacterium]|nr:hypothetical protein [Phycisphaerae bacterium]
MTDVIEDHVGAVAQPSDALVRKLYPQLKRLAAAYLRHERPDHTLQATALVHETYLRFAHGAAPWRDEAHFFRAAAVVMRRILVNHAVRRTRAKRGGGAVRVALTPASALVRTSDEELIGIHEGLEQLGKADPRKREVVELRYFAGLSIPQVAEVTGLSERTVEREWRTARAWLRARLEARG